MAKRPRSVKASPLLLFRRDLCEEYQLFTTITSLGTFKNSTFKMTRRLRTIIFKNSNGLRSCSLFPSTQQSVRPFDLKNEECVSKIPISQHTHLRNKSLMSRDTPPRSVQKQTCLCHSRQSLTKFQSRI